MRALVVENGRATWRDDLASPAPGPGESRVRVLCAGVCATDLALLRGYMNFSGIPGHEFVGEVVQGPLVGQRVVGEINAACGQCERCRRGLGRHCAARTVLGILARSGAFCEELCLPDTNLHVVPPDLPNDVATFTEPLAAAFEIAEQLDLSRFERALVLGDGRLGLLCIQVLCRAGLAVDVLGRHPERSALLPDTARYVTGAEDASHELVVEATGTSSALEDAIRLSAPRGTIVLKTTSEAYCDVDLAPVVVNELQIVGSRCGPFAPALAALASGEVRVDGMIHARYPLAAAAQALEHAAQPGVLKVLIDIDETP